MVANFINYIVTEWTGIFSETPILSCLIIALTLVIYALQLTLFALAFYSALYEWDSCIENSVCGIINAELFIILSIILQLIAFRSLVVLLFYAFIGFVLRPILWRVIAPIVFWYWKKENY